MEQKRVLCSTCKKPVYGYENSLEDDMFVFLEEVVTGISRQPYGFCRCAGRERERKEEFAPA